MHEALLKAIDSLLGLVSKGVSLLVAYKLGKDRERLERERNEATAALKKAREAEEVREKFRTMSPDEIEQYLENQYRS